MAKIPITQSANPAGQNVPHPPAENSQEYDVHPRTLEAKARCKNSPSCHDCAMTCPHGNQVRDEHGQMRPCGSEIFDSTGYIILCGECVADQRQSEDYL